MIKYSVRQKSIKQPVTGSYIVTFVVNDREIIGLGATREEAKIDGIKKATQYAYQQGFNERLAHLNKRDGHLEHSS